MNSPSTNAENKMGTMPVNRLLISMSLPMMISMLVQALYNIIDSMFVSQIGESALTAVSLAFTMQNLMIAVSIGTGVGINALLSRSLGERNQKKVNAAALNGLLLTFLGCLIFVVVGLFFIPAFYRSQTNDLEIIQYGCDYLQLICLCSFSIFGQVVMERLLQATGKTFYTMITQGIGAVINIILDPILIFGYFGFPEMGVAGAAVATIIGQTIALLISIYFNVKKNPDISLNFKGFRPDLGVIKEIYAVGIPSIAMQSVSSVMTYGINKIIIPFTPTAVAVFGVYFKIQSFIFMPVFGLNNGMVPIVAYNYGARSVKRMMDTIKYSLIYAVVIMTIGFLIFEIFPKELLLLFNASNDMLEIGVPALRIIAPSFLLAGFCIILSSVFQALGNGMYALITSIARQLVVLLPAAFLLSKTGTLALVWWSFPIAEIASVLFCFFFMKRIYQNVIKPLS